MRTFKEEKFGKTRATDFINNKIIKINKPDFDRFNASLIIC